MGTDPRPAAELARRPQAPGVRCRQCGSPATGGWTECPEDGIWRDLVLDEASGFYVDDLAPPRYVLEPESVDGRIVCAACEARETANPPS